MHLVVDSGSTKSDWVLIDGVKTQTYTTSGLNPNFHDEDSVYSVLSSNLELIGLGDKVDTIFFYGAGCSSVVLNAIIAKGLKRVFTKAVIKVDHDLKASAIATYQGAPSISCILGTGSNACFFDGETVSQNIPSLGYILGDEGSGAFFGKQLIKDFLYKKLPSNMHKSFQENYDLTKDDIFKYIYRTPNANTYLASFMKFIVQHKNEQYVKEMIKKGFKEFIEAHVCIYHNYKAIKVNFVGSIAHLFSNELYQACSYYKVEIGQIVKKPINGLVNFHQKQII